MGTILLLGLAAAVYPQLLAVVVVILTRPRPQPLLWACYLASLLVAAGCAIALLAIFRSDASVAGTSSHRLGPSAYLAVGVIAVVVAIFVARRARAVPEGDSAPPRRRQDRSSDRPPGAVQRATSRAHRALGEGSLAFAAVVGAMLAVPGPFDLLAFGHMARGGYTTVELGVLIGVFTLIKFVLIEVPIVGYTISPARTAARVGRFSTWMHANKLDVIAVVVGGIGLVLIVRGIGSMV
ncbi:MAG: GAP family protein [Solirubrobacteraceae bacterium]